MRDDNALTLWTKGLVAGERASSLSAAPTVVGRACSYQHSLPEKVTLHNGSNLLRVYCVRRRKIARESLPVRSPILCSQPSSGPASRHVNLSTAVQARGFGPFNVKRHQNNEAKDAVKLPGHFSTSDGKQTQKAPRSSTLNSDLSLAFASRKERAEEVCLV